MKHIFYAHTHTLFLTALGAVEYLKLKEEDVIFIYTRNYKNTSINIPYKEIDLSAIFAGSMKNGEVFHFWKLNRLVHVVDQIISKEIGSDYLAYLPHLGVFLPQVLATNKYCKGIRFVEEGINCYSSSLGVRKNTLREILKRCYSTAVNQYRRYWFSDYPFYYDFLKTRFVFLTELFGIAPNSFLSLCETKHIVKWPKVRTGFKLDTSNPIYIFEAAIEQKFVSSAVYLAAVKTMIDETGKFMNYIKFHPGQSEENKNMIRQYFFDLNKEITEIPQNVSFEIIMTKYSKLEIIGFGSSLLLYAKNLGHVVSSHENLLIDDFLYKRYKEKVNFKI